MRTVVEQRPERIRRFRSFRADDTFRPTTVIDRVVGLHAGNYVLDRESWNIIRVYVLCVFHSEAPVPVAILRCHLVVDVQQIANGLVSDRMDYELEPGRVRTSDPGTQIVE